jgi:hypothetical protein
MSDLAKVISLSYDSAAVTITSALKTYYRSVRLIKNSGMLLPDKDSKYTNILLCGNCVDPETRNLYVFYIDEFYDAAWIIEINIDSRTQTVVYYDKYNAIGFDPLHKIYNPRIVYGRLIWTDNKNPIYQMDVNRAKQSFKLGIGYGQNEVMAEWSATTPYPTGRIVSNGNNFYQALVYNSNVEPRLDSGSIWKKLCLIEDAYYSMNIRNFYFEPMPPSHPPDVSYQSDDTRKVNNLRQTLFQIAYRYVYMDWRRSTYSPASIVPVPQAEEETATGFANEQISLNNKLQITFNSGGEEVRAIEVIGRSSQDTSKWFLIDTIYKFEAQERGNEISKISLPGYIGLGLTVEQASAIGVNNSDSLQEQLSISIPTPFVLNTYTSAKAIGFTWEADESGNGNTKTVEIDCNPELTYLTSFPDWLVVVDTYVLVANMSVKTGDVLSLYPSSNNTGAARSGYVVLTNQYGDLTRIMVTQSAIVIPPVIPVYPTVLIDPQDTSGLILIGANASAQSGSADITLSCEVNNPGYNVGDLIMVYWRSVVNGIAEGNGILTNVPNEGALNRIITLNNTLVNGQPVIIYLSAQAIQNVQIDKTAVLFAPLQPATINSGVSASIAALGWLAAAYGSAVKQTDVITCPPVNCFITSKPSWITILDNAGFTIGAGAAINNGETISLYPTAENLGGVLSGYIVLTNIYGDSASILVTQNAALTPPVGTPVPCSIQLYSGDISGMAIPGSYATASSGDNRVTWSCSITGLSGSTIYWKAYKAGSGIIQGSGSFSAHNGSNYGTFVLNNNLTVNDVVTIYFSSVNF